MLPESMKGLVHIMFCFFLPLAVQAQVEINTSLRLIGEQEQRRVDGLAPATSPSSAITVEASVLGGAHWAEASASGQTVTLSQTIAIEEYRPGILLRFVWPADMHGAMSLQYPGLAALPLHRPDGHDPIPGQLTAGTIAEVIQAIDRWILISPTEHGCPPGSLAVHPGLCMEVASGPDALVYDAMDQCQARGGKLCTWDEYYLGCTELGGFLENTFVAWEWLDDTSNHTHSVEQAGRYTCRSQRSIHPVILGRVRCCYHPR